MKPEPSSATSMPARFHGMPSMRTGPLIAGSSDAGLMTCGPAPSGSISMRKRPGAVLLRSIAQRSEPSPPSAVRVTRSVSMAGAGCASACGRSMSSVTQAIRSSVCNFSSRFPGSVHRSRAGGNPRTNRRLPYRAVPRRVMFRSAVVTERMTDRPASRARSPLLRLPARPASQRAVRFAVSRPGR